MLTEPLLPVPMSTPPDLENSTMDDLKRQKAELAEQRERAAEGHLATPAPVPSWLVQCCAGISGTFLYRNCVARNPKTKLNELHMMQPLMFAFVAAGVGLLAPAGLVLSRMYTPSMEVAIAVGAGQLVTSCLLLYVGRIAASIPSQEDLNVQLDEHMKGLGGGVEGVEDASDDARDLETRMKVNWVGNRKQTLDKTRELQATYLRDVQVGARFEFKCRLLEYLSAGEAKRCWRKQNAVEMEYEQNYEEKKKQFDNPIVEMKREKAALAPNGLLSYDELREVVDEVKQIEHAADATYMFLGRLIEDMLADEDLKLRAKDEGKGNKGERGDQWSYNQIVETLVARAEDPQGEFHADYLKAFCAFDDPVLGSDAEPSEASGRRASRNSSSGVSSPGRKSLMGPGAASARRLTSSSTSSRSAM